MCQVTPPTPVLEDPVQTVQAPSGPTARVGVPGWTPVGSPPDPEQWPTHWPGTPVTPRDSGVLEGGQATRGQPSSWSLQPRWEHSSWGVGLTRLILKQPLQAHSPAGSEASLLGPLPGAEVARKAGQRGQSRRRRGVCRWWLEQKVPGPRGQRALVHRRVAGPGHRAGAHTAFHLRVVRLTPGWRGWWDWVSPITPFFFFFLKILCIYS